MHRNGAAGVIDWLGASFWFTPNSFPDDTFRNTRDAPQGPSPYSPESRKAHLVTRGLLVGLSLNLNKILAYPALPIRAMIALILLLLVLIVSSIVLIPGQKLNAIGTEMFIVAITGWGSVTAMDVHVFRKTKLQSNRRYVFNMILLQVATFPYVIGNVKMLLGCTSGFYLMAIGVVASFVKAVFDAWVLLVEINR